MEERGEIAVTALEQVASAVSEASGHSSQRRGDLFDPACPTRRLLDRIGGKWTSMVVKLLVQVHPAELRFAELRRRMPGVSHKMLSTTLQALARDGLVVRRVEDAVPPRVHYRLTDLGLSLEAPLAGLRCWAEDHMSEVDRAAATWGAQRSGS